LSSLYIGFKNVKSNFKRLSYIRDYVDVSYYIILLI